MIRAFDRGVQVSRVEIRVLSPGWLTVDGAAVEIGGPRQRAVLTALLLVHPRALPLTGLIDAVWGGEAAPPTAGATVQAYVSRLRKVLVPLGCSIDSVAGAYSVQLGGAWFDLSVFTAEVAAAEIAAREGRPGEVIRRLEIALPLWESTGPYEAVDERSRVAITVAALAQRHRGARRLLTTAYLAVGRPESAVAHLERDLADQPYDETIAADLLIALYRSGRAADALTAYHQFRARLRDELGLDPSSRLEHLQQSVLSSDAALDWRPARDVRSHSFLPPPNPCFVGREDLVTGVEQLLTENSGVALHGLAGCGKSDVALEVAHRHRGPALWVSAEDSASLFAGMVEIATALGVEQGLSSRQVVNAVWEELDQLKDWLVVLDNAGDLDALRQVLPATATGRFLITSQNRAWGAVGPALEVPPFTDEEALDFVLRRTGRKDRAGARALGEELGNLPLALEQACAYVEETGLQLAEYVGHFRASHDRLLTRGAPTSHRTHVAATWQLLFDRVRSQSRLAGQVLEVAAFLSPHGVPARMLETLAGGDVVAFNDAMAPLLRTSLMSRDDGELRIHRLVQTVLRAGLSPAQRRLRAREAVTAVLAQAPGDPQSPLCWAAWASASAQLVTLLEVVTPEEAPEELIPVALDSQRYFRAHGSLGSARQVLDRIADLIADRHSEDPAVTEWRLEHGNLLDAEGQLAKARSVLEDAARDLRAPGAAPDRSLAARTITRLAHARNCAGDSAEAVPAYLEGIAVLEDLMEVTELCEALIGLGYTHWSLHDYAEAQLRFEQALTELERRGRSRHPLFAEALSGRGMMLHEQGELEEARADQVRALSLLHAVHGDRDTVQIAETRDKLGYVLGLMGQWDESHEHHLAATDILARLFGEHDTRYATALANLGLAETGLGRPDVGHERQRRALEILLGAYGERHPTVRVIADRLGIEPRGTR